MIRSLFARLTGEPRRGQAMFDAAVSEARQPHWFIEGEVPDTVEGRFAVLATIIALMIVRLERDGSSGEAATVALTERFVDSLDVEIREMGVGDPTLGKQVRKLVGALAGRVERWRTLVNAGEWTSEVRRSLYRDEPVSAGAVAHSESALRAFWIRLVATDAEALAYGRTG
jgi:cytochrome b pre-mRNA-processing protein 3